MAQYGFNLGGLNDAYDQVKGLYNRVSGNTVQDYVKSPEFMEKVLTGYRQQMAGEDPRGLIEAQNDLVSKGWGPKTSAGYIQGLIGHLDTARQKSSINKVQQENAPRTEFGAPEPMNIKPIEGQMGPGLEQSPDLNLSFGKPVSVPGKNLSQSQAMDIMGPGKAWENPSQVGSFMKVPNEQAHTDSQTNENIQDTSTKKTLENIKIAERAALDRLPSSSDPNYQPDPRALAQFPSLANMLPQRDRAEDPLLEERRKLLQAQAGADTARGDWFNQRDRGGARAGAAGSETTTDRIVKPQDQLIAERAIAKAADDRGLSKMDPSTHAEALRKIADDFGFELSGTPTFSPSSKGILGMGAAPATMTGDFNLRPKGTTKTVTRGNPALAPRSAAPPAGPAGPATTARPATIRVRRKSDGQTGNLPSNEFDPNVYEKIQ